MLQNTTACFFPLLSLRGLLGCLWHQRFHGNYSKWLQYTLPEASLIISGARGVSGVACRELNLVEVLLLHHWKHRDCTFNTRKTCTRAEAFLTHKSSVLKVDSCSAASYSYLRQCAMLSVSGTAMAPFPPKAHEMAITSTLTVKLH